MSEGTDDAVDFDSELEALLEAGLQEQRRRREEKKHPFAVVRSAPGCIVLHGKGNGPDWENLLLTEARRQASWWAEEDWHARIKEEEDENA